MVDLIGEKKPKGNHGNGNNTMKVSKKSLKKRKKNLHYFHCGKQGHIICECRFKRLEYISNLEILRKQTW